LIGPGSTGHAPDATESHRKNTPCILFVDKKSKPLKPHVLTHVAAEELLDLTHDLVGMFARQTVAQLDIAGRDRVYDAFMFVGVFLGQTVIE
jgi:hypothetical protein